MCINGFLIPQPKLSPIKTPIFKYLDIFGVQDGSHGLANVTAHEQTQVVSRFSHQRDEKCHTCCSQGNARSWPGTL